MRAFLTRDLQVYSVLLFQAYKPVPRTQAMIHRNIIFYPVPYFCKVMRFLHKLAATELAISRKLNWREVYS